MKITSKLAVSMMSCFVLALTAVPQYAQAEQTFVTIGTGGSVGREGPIIQIGSSLGSTVGQFFRIPSKRLKTLVG